MYQESIEINYGKPAFLYEALERSPFLWHPWLSDHGIRFVIGTAVIDL